MPSVALPVSVTNNSRPAHSQQDRNTRGADPAAAPFASMLDHDEPPSDTPARPDTVAKSEDSHRTNAPQRQKNRPEQAKHADANEDAPAPAQPGNDKTAADSKGDTGKTADDLPLIDTPKSDGDADKPATTDAVTDASAATGASAALTEQTLAAVVPVAVAIAAPQPLQNAPTVEAETTAVVAVQVSAVAQTTAPADPKAAVVALSATETPAIGDAEKSSDATIPAEAIAETKPVKEKTEAKSAKVTAKDTSGDAKTASPVDADTDAKVAAPADTGAEPDTQASAVAKPAQHETEDAKAAHGKPHAEKDADKLTATVDQLRTNFAANVANAADPARQIGTTAETSGQPVITSAAAAASATAAQTATPSAAVPLANLAVEIATNAKEGKNRFEIRLDPPDLGRIDVRLDIDRAGNVTSRLVVERTDTLDLLRRDSTTLERALNDAGLKTADNGLQFSLRDQNAGGNSGREREPAHTTRIVIPTDVQATADMPRYRGQRLGALDIRV